MPFYPRGDPPIVYAMPMGKDAASIAPKGIGDAGCALVGKCVIIKWIHCFGGAVPSGRPG